MSKKIVFVYFKHAWWPLYHAPEDSDKRQNYFLDQLKEIFDIAAVDLMLDIIWIMHHIRHAML
jgi:hypothetical protein